MLNTRKKGTHSLFPIHPLLLHPERSFKYAYLSIMPKTFLQLPTAKDKVPNISAWQKDPPSLAPIHLDVLFLLRSSMAWHLSCHQQQTHSCSITLHNGSGLSSMLEWSLPHLLLHFLLWNVFLDLPSSRLDQECFMATPITGFSYSPYWSMLPFCSHTHRASVQWQLHTLCSPLSLTVSACALTTQGDSFQSPSL